MRIVIVGNGVIGGGLAARLEAKHELIVASRSSPEWSVDIESRDSIRRFFDRVGTFDALVSAAGDAWLGPFAELDEEKLAFGLRSKLMGQLNLVLEGRQHVAPRGSFTLTSGFLSRVPVRGTVGLGIVNGAIESFVGFAATELSPARINVVSPGAVEETVAKLGERVQPLIPTVSLDRVLTGYARSVFGPETGQVFELF
jgi:NAD(P)-dependent dehydrogenase (short-subunit alcohol dehydrogenase family)